MTYDELVAELIRLRKAKGWTKCRLAQEMGATHVGKLEHKQVTTPRGDMLQRWCNALGKHYYYTLEDA